MYFKNNFLVKQTAFISLIFIFVGCGPIYLLSSKNRSDKNEDLIIDDNTIKNKDQVISQCDRNKLSFMSELDINGDKPLDLFATIEHIYEHVYENKCDGTVVDKGVKVINPQMTKVFLSNPIPGKRFYGVALHLQPGCDTKSTIITPGLVVLDMFYNTTSDGLSGINVKLDLADTLLNLKVREGLNNIYVRYYYDCFPSGHKDEVGVLVGQSNCQNSRDYKTVAYRVKIESKHIDRSDSEFVISEKCPKN